MKGLGILKPLNIHKIQMKTQARISCFQIYLYISLLCKLIILPNLKKCGCNLSFKKAAQLVIYRL